MLLQDPDDRYDACVKIREAEGKRCLDESLASVPQDDKKIYDERIKKLNDVGNNAFSSSQEDMSESAFEDQSPAAIVKAWVLGCNDRCWAMLNYAKTGKEPGSQ